MAGDRAVPVAGPKCFLRASPCQQELTLVIEDHDQERRVQDAPAPVTSRFVADAESPSLAVDEDDRLAPFLFRYVRSSLEIRDTRFLYHARGREFKTASFGRPQK